MAAEETQIWARQGLHGYLQIDPSVIGKEGRALKTPTSHPTVLPWMKRDGPRIRGSRKTATKKLCLLE